MPLTRRTPLTNAGLPLLLVLTLSCGDGTGPSGQNLSGTWTFTTNLTGSGARACTTSNFTMQLHQSGTGFSGTYTGTLTCTEQGALVFSSGVAGDVVNGQLTPGGAVSFYFDVQSVSWTGSLNSSDAMGGQGSWWFNLGPPTGVVIFGGTWTATR